MREDFQGGKDGFRLKILLDSSNRASENQKTLMILATILSIILNYYNFVVAQSLVDRKGSIC